MKSLFLWSFLLVFLCKLSAQDWDSSSPKHLGAGVVIGAVGGYTSNKIFRGDMRWTWAGAVGGALVAGLVKESIDKADYGRWDNNDVLYTTLGGAISGLVLELLMNKNRRRGRGRPCSCYATSYNSEKAFSRVNVNVTISGSRSLSSNIQAQYFLNKQSDK
ncbi:hypothetical protein [uncultured Maribacter sp.]|uniref:hypothetical protein n=1 Tax=uncultured Maribacter sp. TaxID=431308 RepID=UPI0026365017|nr:hypothetical protein [uncultured Maribacter sp.]